MLNATVCRYEHFETEWYRRWARHLGIDPSVSIDRQIAYRKVWEWAAILEALNTREMLAPRRRGLGFAVGREPLPAVLASFGCEVVATDLMPELVGDQWSKTGQHAASLEELYHGQYLPRDQFDRLVRFHPADMNDLSALEGQYDFIWSSCAFEHLGSLEHGLAFFEESMRLLKPGGIAVHTTEINVTSNDDTIETGDNVLYRKRDMEALDYRLRKIRCGLEPIDFDAGTHPFDLNYDPEPYFSGGSVHIKLHIGSHICTSMLVVARKG